MRVATPPVEFAAAQLKMVGLACIALGLEWYRRLGVFKYLRERTKYDWSKLHSRRDQVAFAVMLVLSQLPWSWRHQWPIRRVWMWSVWSIDVSESGNMGEALSQSGSMGENE